MTGSTDHKGGEEEEEREPREIPKNLSVRNAKSKRRENRLSRVFTEKTPSPGRERTRYPSQGHVEASGSFCQQPARGARGAHGSSGLRGPRGWGAQQGGTQAFRRGQGSSALGAGWGSRAPGPLRQQELSRTAGRHCQGFLLQKPAAWVRSRLGSSASASGVLGTLLVWPVTWP